MKHAVPVLNSSFFFQNNEALGKISVPIEVHYLMENYYGLCNNKKLSLFCPLDGILKNYQCYKSN